MALFDSTTGVPASGAGRRFAAQVRAELAADRLVLALIAAYVAAAVAAALALGVNPSAIALYTPIWIGGLLCLWGGWIVAVELPPAIRADPARPLQALGAAVRARLTPRLVAGACLYMAVALFYGAFTFFKSALPLLVPFHADPMLAALDAALHGGVDPWRLLHPLLGHHAVTRTIELIYSAVWSLLVFAVPLFMCSSRRCAHLRRRFLLTFIACWMVLGNLMALGFMSGGPVFYALITGDMARFGELTSYLEFSRGLRHSALGARDYLWTWYQRGEPGVGSGISAFPSLHLATSTLFCLTLRAVRPGLTWLGVAFVAVILAGSVHLGWHYAVDGYVSIAATIGFWWLAGRLDRSQRSIGKPGATIVANT
jgi:hypothetical protein